MQQQHDGSVVYQCRNDDGNVKQVVAVAEVVKLARPEALWHTRCIQRGPHLRNSTR